MQIVEDPALRQAHIDILAKEYQMMEPRQGIHASDLIYCITKSYWNKIDYLPPSEDDILRFSIGLGLERVIIQYQATRVEPLHVEGIDLSPDFLIDNIHSELKTTRWGVNHELPETWMKQVMAYCYATGIPLYNLTVMHIIQAVIKSYRLLFEQEELEENWGWMLNRKEILEQQLSLSEETGEVLPPEAFKYNEDRECGFCRYKLRCDLAASLKGLGDMTRIQGYDKPGQ